jgi:aryl-alcohol dehydrogenase-like predicted oxidoreductase
MPRIPRTDLDVHRLCLGTNVFGWTADHDASFAVLDAYAEAGGNFIDTADVYSAWVDGHTGGESETLIGAWMRERGNRDDIVLATKLGGDGGLGAANVRAKAEASLTRLGTDRIDLLYAHRDDPGTPVAETLRAFGALVESGSVRYVAASNFAAGRLRESLETSRREGLPAYVALQPKYNLVERDEYEGALRDLCAEAELGCVPYYGLARGFLTGKYRPGGKDADTRRPGAEQLLDERTGPVLETLDTIAEGHDVPVAAVALAWLAAQPTVVSPIASARTPEQLADLLPVAGLDLTDDELERLGALTAG